MEKEIIGALAVALNLGNGAFYIWQIFKRGIKPHAFSWVIWGVLSLIIFLAQTASGAGPGAWVMGSAALLCFAAAIASLFRGEKDITRGDWIVFALALTAIPAWIATKDPLWAVVIATAIDAIAFYPTVRKSWVRPHEESIPVFAIFALQMLLGLLALNVYSVTNVLNPLVVLIFNVGVTVMLFSRRKALAA